MNAWWWVPIGLVAWFAVSVAWDCGSARFSGAAHRLGKP